MGRPPLGLGTYGKIDVKQVAPKTWQARCKFRQRNGKIVRPAARGSSETAATNALKARLVDWTASAKKGDVTRDTFFRDVAELYMADLEYKVKQDGRSPNTLRTYRSAVKVIVPYIGELRMWELEESVAVIDDMIKTVHGEMSYESAKKARSLTSAICAFGIRRGAKITNPVREVEELARGARDPIKAMTLVEIAEMLQGLQAYGLDKAAETDRLGRRLGKRGAVWTDLAELAATSLALGQRLGEGLALAGIDVLAEEIDEDDRIPVRLDAHIIRVRGEGLRRVPGRKSSRPGLTVRAPRWATPMLLRRKQAAGDTGPLFPATDGGWLDQDNTNKRLREALDAAGFGWVSAKVWRSTVGTLLGHAGLSAEDVAEHLGNTRAVAERHYVAPRRIAEKGAVVLEALGSPVAQ
jgi:integrase